MWQSADTENPGATENQGHFDSHERNTFALSACSWLVSLIKTAGVIPLHAFVDADSECSSAVYKMKIEPAMISFTENTTSSKMADQCGPKKKEKKIFLCFHKFQMDDKWSECMELTEQNLRNVFFFIPRVFVLFGHRREMIEV